MNNNNKQQIGIRLLLIRIVTEKIEKKVKIIQNYIFHYFDFEKIEKKYIRDITTVKLLVTSMPYELYLENLIIKKHKNIKQKREIK